MASHSPIKTPKQLITVVVLAFIVPILIIVLLVVFVAGNKKIGEGTASMSPEAIAERMKPIGTVAVAGEGGGSGPKTLQTGEAVYKLSCAACHLAGIAGAPKTGDAGAWGPRLKKGFDGLTKSAIEGIKAMPPKGGNADLDNVEVARAVAYIANQSGGRFKEPDAAAGDAKKADAPTAKKSDAPAAKK